MRFQLDEEQVALLDAVGTLLSRRAGTARARALGGASPKYDAELDSALAEAGFTGLAVTDGAGPLEAALVAEAVAKHLGLVPFGAAALVAANLGLVDGDGPIALTTAEFRGPVRFAGDARTLLVLDGDVARVVPIAPGTFAPVASRYCFPLGEVDRIPGGGSSLGPGSGARMLAWWRVALAIEAVGAMEAALDLTVGYTRERRQFGRPIGSFQTVQHHLAELAFMVDGARWLALEAAWSGAPGEGAAAALSQALSVARRLPPELHQYTGALGFAEEYDLYLWTMRLPALVIEAGWSGAPERDLVAARWAPAQA